MIVINGVSHATVHERHDAPAVVVQQRTGDIRTGGGGASQIPGPSTATSTIRSLVRNHEVGCSRHGSVATGCGPCLYSRAICLRRGHGTHDGRKGGWSLQLISLRPLADDSRLLGLNSALLAPTTASAGMASTRSAPRRTRSPASTAVLRLSRTTLIRLTSARILLVLPLGPVSLPSLPLA